MSLYKIEGKQITVKDSLEADQDYETEESVSKGHQGSGDKEQPL